MKTGSLPTLAELLERLESNAELIGKIQGSHRGTAMPQQDSLAVAGLRKANDEHRAAILKRCAP